MLNESFLKSDHPAVVRSRPVQPGANTADGDIARPAGEHREDDEAQVGNNTFSEYIVPIPDINTDGALELEDTATQSTSRYGMTRPTAKLSSWKICRFN